MRVLITGHSGLLGSHLASSLVKTAEVFGISRTERNQVDGVQNFYCDLRDREKTEKIILDIKPEYVFHLAANAAENASVFAPVDVVTNSVNTFLNALVASIKTKSLKKFNFTSSVAVYGAISVPFREQDLPLPQDIYGVAKLSIEQMLRVMSKVHCFGYSITRPHNVYGEGQRMDDPYRNVITIFMNHLLMRKPYTIYGDGSMKRCFSYVRDVVGVIAQAGMDSKTGLTLNVGSDRAVSLQELSGFVQDAAGVKIEPQYLPTRVHEVHSALPDHTLCKAVYGYYDTDLRKGLKKTWVWCKEQGAQKYNYRKLEIISRKIPKNWRDHI